MRLLEINKKIRSYVGPYLALTVMSPFAGG